MNLGQAILEALESLASNKLRSGLTILGIVIGVGAVIAMLGVGQGAQDTITGSISGIGSNLLFVFSGNMQEDVRNEQPLTRNDANAIADPFQAPSVAAVAPVLQGNAEVTFGSERTGVSIYGVTPDYAPVRNYAVVEGEFINTEHLLGQASVALLGPDTAQKLFGRTDGVTGETIRINGQPFRVIGVLESKGGGSFGSQDDVILVPFDTAQARLIRRSRDRVDLIFVQVADPSLVNQAREEVAQILRTRHRTELGADDFTIFSQDDFVATAQTITGVLTIFLGGIAAISLLVGGIGIMNIMLVSVTERTREIGLRKALGARRKDILIQFLTESSLLSLIGGLLGIGLGWLIAFIVGRVAAASNTPFTPSIGLDAILLATVFSTAVGLFFGLYPANRAASLEPVEALRYE
ncbi:MAG TPA: ABC transporter permease [Anaerolineaceae bacterium]|jgi:putative ABC transport system permease protein|nr:ABC transporter permease [Anaerolineaceae bacterium]NMD30860.1 FtsX-like permease family protein [Chloroflexota bacterium]HNS63667.1 ABC transporter permease [Anaerolineaceae bacterium]HNY99704.1 ABC transporter permease [Anaerolineaceae bacterium]HOD43653.1 ABC transporter permease [Anaerolineaceae bacterium]